MLFNLVSAFVCFILKELIEEITSGYTDFISMTIVSSHCMKHALQKDMRVLVWWCVLADLYLAATVKIHSIGFLTLTLENHLTALTVYWGYGFQIWIPPREFASSSIVRHSIYNEFKLRHSKTFLKLQESHNSFLVFTKGDKLFLHIVRLC